MVLPQSCLVLLTLSWMRYSMTKNILKQQQEKTAAKKSFHFCLRKTNSQIKKSNHCVSKTVNQFKSVVFYENIISYKGISKSLISCCVDFSHEKIWQSDDFQIIPWLPRLLYSPVNKMWNSPTLETRAAKAKYKLSKSPIRGRKVPILYQGVYSVLLNWRIQFYFILREKRWKYNTLFFFNEREFFSWFLSVKKKRLPSNPPKTCDSRFFNPIFSKFGHSPI